MLDFWGQDVNPDSTTRMSLCVQQVNLGHGLVQGVFWGEMEGPRRQKGGGEKGGETMENLW